MQSFYKIKKAVFVLLVIFTANTKFCFAQFGATQSFDGSTQSIVTPSGMMNGSTVFTIEFFIKTTENRSNGTYWQRPSMISSASNYSSSGDFGITTDNGYIGMWSGLNSSGDNSYQSATVQINDNAWHHVAAVNNGTIVSLYVDGSLTGTITSGLGLATNTAPLTLGSSSLDFGFAGNVGLCNFFHAGLMDEVRFSSNVRYTGNFTVPSAAFTADANTVALYHLDGCVNGLVPDASVNANNASPKNLTGSCTFVLPSPPTIPANPALTNIIRAEYFYDTDPGFGNGTPISVSAATDVTLNPALNLTGLSDGAHRVYFRTRDAAGNWGITNMKTFVIFSPAPVIPSNPTAAQIVKVEYFYDTDPGFGNGTNIPVTSSFDLTGTFAVNLTGLTEGAHRIFLRTKDAAGKWSISNVAVFNIIQLAPTIPSNAAPTNIVKAEYFVDTDPGFGNGTNIPLTAGPDVTVTNAMINITGLSDGAHRVFVRTKDTAGHWSITNINTFSIVAATISIPPNPVPGMLTKLEYFFDTDPGFGNGTSVSFAPTTDLSSFSFAANISSLADGTHTLFVRAYDGWGLTNTRTFTIGAVVPVSWLSFNAKAVKETVQLDWQTTNEINADHFETERSADGRQFVSIGTTAAANNNAAVNNYRLVDPSPLQGINYYRIKAVDHNGSFKYSVILSVYFGKEKLITVYPNPANDAVNVLFDQKQSANSFIMLIGSNGQTLRKMNTAGMQSARMNVADLAAGIYELKIMNGNGTSSTEKVLIRH